jgi:hypothetical protein
MTGRRAILVALALLAGCALARPVAAQPARYSYQRIEVTSGARIAASLADGLRDALAARLSRSDGVKVTVRVTILDAREAQDGMHLAAIVALVELESERILVEFDAEATTPAAPSAREALQAEALADSIAATLATR